MSESMVVFKIDAATTVNVIMIMNEGVRSVKGGDSKITRC
jgi:hypothetical protein